MPEVWFNEGDCEGGDFLSSSGEVEWCEGVCVGAGHLEQVCAVVCLISV